MTTIMTHRVTVWFHGSEGKTGKISLTEITFHISSYMTQFVVCSEYVLSKTTVHLNKVLSWLNKLILYDSGVFFWETFHYCLMQFRTDSLCSILFHNACQFCIKNVHYYQIIVISISSKNILKPTWNQNVDVPQKIKYLNTLCREMGSANAILCWLKLHNHLNARHLNFPHLPDSHIQ